MDFYRRMHLVCMCIPRGKVASYGQIALLCGRPKNARQAGYALNRGLAGEDVPAWRIVNGKGILSGASAFDMPDLQKRLLEREGVEVAQNMGNYQVDMKRFGWKNTVEDALAFLEEFKKKEI